MRDTMIEHDIRKMLERDFKLVDNFDTEKGGIYIEITEDPRGWVLGDKTRKIYDISNLKLKLLTDLLVIVTSNRDGSEIKVSVYNPKEIGRMLLSKNDDVGSSIQYAHVEESMPVELTAKMGEHVCIESIMKGNWIRAQIFPGTNMIDENWIRAQMFPFVDIIKRDESEILKLLESPDTYVKEKLQELVSRYYSTGDEIDIFLSGLRNFGGECDCRNPEVFKQIHEGDFDEIIKICIVCGGSVD